jgi:hypothetical protein
MRIHRANIEIGRPFAPSPHPGAPNGVVVRDRKQLLLPDGFIFQQMIERPFIRIPGIQTDERSGASPKASTDLRNLLSVPLRQFLRVTLDRP